MQEEGDNIDYETQKSTCAETEYVNKESSRDLYFMVTTYYHANPELNNPERAKLFKRARKQWKKDILKAKQPKNKKTDPILSNAR